MSHFFHIIPVFALPLIFILLILLLLLPFILFYLFLRITEEAFELVGFGHRQAMFMTFGAIFLSFIDIPLYSVGNTVIAVNAGGCLIPLFVSLEIMAKRRYLIRNASITMLMVAAVSYYYATPTPGVGIQMPFYIAPLTAGITAVVLSRGIRDSPAAAYIGGALGTLLGADVLNILQPGVLRLIATDGVTTLSIGGAGVFDGIFLTGVLAVFLAVFLSRRH